MIPLLELDNAYAHYGLVRVPMRQNPVFEVRRSPRTFNVQGGGAVNGSKGTQ